MCLAIPSKVLEVNEDKGIAKVDTMGRIRDVSTHPIPDAIAVGDYLLIQHGFAMEKIDETTALDSLELFEEIVDKMETGAI